ncbi:MAG: sensor histidine kinase [Proteobacteria bacterium]|nr:sensor histidine kinase [Pseudomonadota bacterium]
MELLRGLVTSGALIDEGKGWTVGRGIDLSVSSQAAEQLVTRLARLAPTRLSALEALAVMGRSSSLDDALRVWSGDPVDLLAAFEDARRQQLVWTEAHGTRYTFAHDRIREAVLGQIETARLRALHVQAAASYEGEGGRAVYALAHHLHEGDAPERAFPYALAAARDAHARHALDLSEGFYRRAMRGCPNRAAELEVVEGLAEVLLRRGRYDESVRLWRRIREAATDALTRARAFGRIGEIGMKTGSREAYDDLAEALRLLGHPVPQGSVATGVAIVSQIAVQCLHSMAPSRFLARRSLRDAEGDLLASVIFDRMKQLTGLESRFPLTFWSHLRSLNTIERYPPTRQLGWVWIEHGEVLTLIAWFSRARRYLDRGLALPETRSDPLQLARGLSRKGFLHYRSGALRSASELFTDALERLMRHSEEFWEIEILRFYLARVEFFRGRVSSATRLAREVHEKLRDGGDPCVGYAALADVVRNTGGRVPREALGEISLDLPPLANAEIHLGHGLWHLGRGEAALAAQRFRLSRFTTGGLEPTSHYVTRSCWEATAWRFAASTLAVGAGALRATYIRRARAAARRARTASTRSPVHLAHALLESAVLEAESGREVSARRLFRDALKTAVEQENHYYFAFALYERGRVGAALGWSDASENLRDGAWAFRAIGLDPTPLEHFRLPAPQEVEAPPRLGLVDRFIGVIEAGRSIVSCLTEEAVLEAVRVAVIELLRPQRCLVWRERPPRGSSRSSLLVPLLVRGTPRVWMEAVHDDLDGFFRDDERMLAAHLAAIGGAALENADRFEAVRGLTRTLEAQGVELRASLEEKEAMLREIHHRVKNNLQIVVSLLSLQASHVDDPRVANAFGEVANRIHSMALIHEFVSGGDDMSEVPMDRYLRTLVDHVVFSQGSGGVRAIFGLEEITLPMSVAVDCGLVVNELVSNALEHGFPEGRKGMVKVSLYRADRGLCLEVADDGVGIDATRTPSLGLTLVGVLSRKLGTMRVESSASGTRTRIDFHG